MVAGPEVLRLHDPYCDNGVRCRVTVSSQTKMTVGCCWHRNALFNNGLLILMFWPRSCIACEIVVG